MRSLLSWSAVAGTVVVGLTLAAPPAFGHHSPATTEPGTLTPVIVTVTNSRLVLSQRLFERGSAAQFYIVNRSAKARVFRVGTERTREIGPGKDGAILVHFGTRGNFQVFVLGGGQRLAARIRVF